MADSAALAGCLRDACRMTPIARADVDRDPVRACLRVLAALWLALAGVLPAAGAPAAPLQPAVALHYGAAPPIDELRVFDLVVLEPEHVPDPRRLPSGTTEWFAYASVGEIEPRRAYAREVPAAWLRGENPAWKTRLVDHSASGWPQFFAERVIAPLWQQGWRGFFLDTLDSHRRFAATPAAQRAQEDALVAMVEQLHQRFPGIRLIFNRGFEILPRLRGKVHAVAAESLYRGWSAETSSYVEVREADRAWLLAQLQRVRDEHRIPAIAIDYLPLKERALARETAARIRAQGLVPWVTNGAIDLLGVGNIEVQPRRIALLTDLPDGVDMQYSSAYRLLAMPLHYLGFTIDPIDVRGSLPADLLQGRHAALVTWFTQSPTALNPGYADWLQRQVDGGLRLVMMHGAALDWRSGLARELGLARVDAGSGPLRIERADPLVGNEAPPPLEPGATAVQLRGPGQSLLRLRGSTAAAVDPIALTPWGGYALAPYTVRQPALDSPARWIIDPIEFLRRAIGAPDFPVPDVTTEAGRRLLLVHIDGDGFVSRAERPRTPFSGEVLLTDVLQRYRIPHTVSVIQGEIAGNGLFRELSPALEDIARRIFALPHVEIASHSYSHPFYWSRLQKGATEGAYAQALNLVLPGYRFNLEAEIGGSIDYIDRTLAPPGKRTRMFLWTGDTAPPAEAVALADAAGVLNMNGGDTLITRSQPTLTVVAGLGLRRGGGLQVFAPNQNENVYTNNWTGPFYGYQRVIETFELTESPRRLKPINIYYHVYSASKTASLNALHRVYAWALAQPVVPVYASDYARKVLDFHRLAIARDWRAGQPTWRVRSGDDLRTLRVPGEAAVSLADSSSVAGSAPGPAGRYLHLTAAAATVAMGADAAPVVQVRDAAGRIDDFERNPGGIRFALSSYANPRFTLSDARHCRVRIDGRDAAPAASRGDELTYELPAASPAAGTAATARRHLVDVRCGA
jgi:hypothetical protein